MTVRVLVAAATLAIGAAAFISAAQGTPRPAQAPAASDAAQILVNRLDLAQYKAAIKSLTEFGDRREGTQRNRDAVSWIEAQLISYGCATERMTYDLPAPRGGANRGGAGAPGAPTAAPTTARGGAPPATVLTEPLRRREGGATYYGITRRAGVNSNPDAQADPRLAALNAGPVIPGPVPQVFCTKVGSTRPNEVYIISAHMDGIGYGEAANDDGSGSAIVLELARILNMADVATDVSIRFALWNGEERNLSGATAYVTQRRGLQGQEVLIGSGHYPEPKWLGVIQHDMMMWDHGMPRADGTVSPDQRPEADFNIEYQSTAKAADASMKLALAVKLAADRYSKQYPGTLGPHMSNTDSEPFMNDVAAISMRENERGMQTGAGWNPHWHQPTDVFTAFSDKDFLLGLNSAQATLAAIAQLAGVRVQQTTVP